MINQNEYQKQYKIFIGGLSDTTTKRKFPI